MSEQRGMTNGEAIIASLQAENARLQAELLRFGALYDAEDKKAADEIASLRAQLAEANKKLVMADGTLALERGLGIDTHATMVALCQHLTAKHIKLEEQLASARKALEQVAIVCTDNMDRSCDHRMALDFVRQVVNTALSDEKDK